VCKICLNITPGLRAFPQYLAEQGEQMEQFVQDILKRLERKEKGDASVVLPVIPFARNIWGKTSLHLLAERDDLKHANDILKILGSSPTHHHSMDISDVIGWLV